RRAQADSLDDLNLPSAAVRANQNAQRDSSLQLGLARLVGVLRLGTIRAKGKRDTVAVGALVGIALAATRSLVVSHGAIPSGTKAVVFAGPCRVRILFHPRQTEIDDERRQWRRVGIKHEIGRASCRERVETWVGVL